MPQPPQPLWLLLPRPPTLMRPLPPLRSPRPRLTHKPPPLPKLRDLPSLQLPRAHPLPPLQLRPHRPHRPHRSLQSPHPRLPSPVHTPSQAWLRSLRTACLPPYSVPTAAQSTAPPRSSATSAARTCAPRSQPSPPLLPLHHLLSTSSRP